MLPLDKLSQEELPPGLPVLFPDVCRDPLCLMSQGKLGWGREVRVLP